MTGPPEILKAIEKAYDHDIEQTALRIVKHVLPYALLFDEISIVTGSPFSVAFLRDLETSLGVKIVKPDSLSSLAPCKDEVEQVLAAIMRRTDSAVLIKDLYRMSGQFAADLPDLNLTIYSIILSLKMSRALNATVSCSDADLEIQGVGRLRSFILVLDVSWKNFPCS